MSLKTIDSLPLASELKGHSRDRDETVQTIAAGPAIDATDANWIVVDRQRKKKSAKSLRWCASASAGCECCGGEHDIVPSCHEPSSNFKLVIKVFRGNETVQPWLKNDFTSQADAYRFQVQRKNQHQMGQQKEKLSTVLSIEPEAVHAVNSSGGWEVVKLALDSVQLRRSYLHTSCKDTSFMRVHRSKEAWNMRWKMVSKSPI